jgi:hypothetical protein
MINDPGQRSRGPRLVDDVHGSAGCASGIEVLTNIVNSHSQ